MGQRYAAILRTLPEAEVAGYADPDPKALKAVGRVASAPSFADHRALLDAIRPDAVIVCTPDHLHRDAAVDALATGAGILVEKPLAATVDDANAICRRAASVDRPAMVAHILRFDGRYAAGREAVASGRIGRPLHVHAHRYAAAVDRARYSPQVTVLTHLAIHDVDLVRWVTGLEIEATAASAVEDRPGRSAAVTAYLRLSGGAGAALEAAWILPDAFAGRVWTGFTVLGTEGSLDVPSTHTSVIVHSGAGIEYADPTRFFEWPDGTPRGALRDELAAFVDAVRCGGPSPVPLTEGVRAVRVVAALARALETGSQVTVDAE